MTPKVACPQCGEQNYATSPLCWACGAPLKGAPAAAPPPSAPQPSVPKQPEAPQPPPQPEPPPIPEVVQVETLLGAAPDLQHIAPPEAPEVSPNSESRIPNPAASNPEPRKPAEIEAAALRDKEYVTPPVDVDEGPKGFGEWVAYIGQGILHSGGTFRESLDEYDRRRGRKSGTMSSYGCVVTAIVTAIVIAFMVWLISGAVGGR